MKVSDIWESFGIKIIYMDNTWKKHIRSIMGSTNSFHQSTNAPGYNTKFLQIHNLFVQD